MKRESPASLINQYNLYLLYVKQKYCSTFYENYADKGVCLAQLNLYEERVQKAIFLNNILQTITTPCEKP